MALDETMKTILIYVWRRKSRNNLRSGLPKKMGKSKDQTGEGKRQNLAPAMQLSRRYSWRYRKVKFMCAISFIIIIIIIIIILKTQGHPTMISP